MKRKDLYVEIYNTVLTEVHIADRDTLTEILESLSIYKFTDAFSSLLPSLNGDKSYLKNFVEKIKDCTTVQRNYPIGSVDLNRNHSSDVLV